MKVVVIVFGLLFAGLLAADPPEGLYTAQGVVYVGCFQHGQQHNEEVLEFQIVDCSLSNTTPCLVPATCIYLCQSTDVRYVYIGLKYPGQCFCDSVLRGVNQTDSAFGTYCDARCFGDSQIACGSSDHMLVYQCTLPEVTTHVGTHAGISSSVGYNTETKDTTTKMTNKRPQTNTEIIAGAAAGGAAVLIVAGSVVGVCLWRKKSGRRRGGKQRTSLALHDVNSHTSHPPSDPCAIPTVHVPPTPTNIDALYAKPDKKRKQKMSSPDDPSYQDVVPTGAQNQYAAVNDDYPPNTMVQQDSNPYGSIQTDPQYAVVKKGPRHSPNVDVNPIYMGGSDEAKDSLNQENADMLGMVDNIIYE